VEDGPCTDDEDAPAPTVVTSEAKKSADDVNSTEETGQSGVADSQKLIG
jgi:hypothetical protein